MQIDATVIIYFYLLVCLLLMVFNFFHIFQAKRRKQHMIRSDEKWFHEVLSQLQRLKENQEIDPQHLNRLSKQLLRTHILVSYRRSLVAVKRLDPLALRKYLRGIYAVLQELAFQYGRRNSMERAFFADVIQRFPPLDGEEYQPLIDILLSYLDDSTAYCREHVLGALYALGNAQAIENALQLFNESNWFHHPKLIAYGLASFSGDKESLAARLWSKHKKWNTNLMLAVVDYISRCSIDYRQPFYEVLLKTGMDPELRLAILHYFRRHAYEPVRSVLLNALRRDDRMGDTEAIVAAMVLDNYPGDDTEQALRQALSHHNWHVRKNAAASLTKVGLSVAVLQEALESEDPYAQEILLYQLNRGAVSQ